MQDNIIYRLDLTDEQYIFLEQVKKEYIEKLSKMTLEERLQYFKEHYCLEQNLNIEKEINGTIYKVNAYFNGQADESVLNTIFRLTKKILNSLELLKRVWYYVNNYKMICNNLYHTRLSKRKENDNGTVK